MTLQALEQWLAGPISDTAAVADMSARFRRLCDAWDEASALKRAA